MLRRIADSDAEPATKDNLLTIALTLATLALPGPENQEWLRKRFQMFQDLIRDSEIYNIIFQEGDEKGFKRGEMQTLQRVALEMFQMRFPALTPWAKTQITSITDISTLNALILRVMCATSSEQAQDILAHPEDKLKH